MGALKGPWSRKRSGDRRENGQSAGRTGGRADGRSDATAILASYLSAWPLDRPGPSERQIVVLSIQRLGEIIERFLSLRGGGTRGNLARR